jgi:hypothetical protein
MGLFRKKQDKKPAELFWNWFVKNEHRFKDAIGNTEKAHVFLDELITQMKPFNPWLKALAGPYDEKTLELIITADGDIALFCKVEELVAAAPAISNWRITAHKPSIGMEPMSIEMFGHQFNSDNMSFYPLTDPQFPDEISIVIVHADYNEDEDANFQTAGMIYLENALGELNTATMIDKYEVSRPPSPGENVELIPLAKLDGYLKWREKEFVEKYANKEAIRPVENWGVLEAEDREGKPMFATIDSGFRGWEYMAAYPWLVQVDIDYKGDSKGLPDKKQMGALQDIEDELIQKMKAMPSVIFLGHHTHDNRRSIFIHTDDYNPVSKVMHAYIESAKTEYKIVFFIRKDKYWQNMAFFYDAIEE